MWIEYRYEDGSTWHEHPEDQTHELQIWVHEKGGFSWRVVTADVHANTPEGWSATLDDAKRHAETAYMEWYGYSCLIGELEVSLQALKEENAMLRDEAEWIRGRLADYRMMIDGLETAAHEERAAVVAWLRGNRACCEHPSYVVNCASRIAADEIERGEHRREEGE